MPWSELTGPLQTSICNVQPNISNPCLYWIDTFSCFHVSCRYTLPSQQHFYMETQSAVVEPQEGGTFLVHSSTQTLDGVQSAVARALGTPANNIVAGV